MQRPSLVVKKVFSPMSKPPLLPVLISSSMTIFSTTEIQSHKCPTALRFTVTVLTSPFSERCFTNLYSCPSMVICPVHLGCFWLPLWCVSAPSFHPACLSVNEVYFLTFLKRG